MYLLFIVFIGGHNIKLQTFEYEINAIDQMLYHWAHSQQGRNVTFHYEVVKQGEVIDTTFGK